MITRTTNDAFVLLQFVNTLLRTAVLTPVMFGISLVLILRTSVKLSTVLAITVPFIVIGVIVIAKISEPLSETQQKRLDKLNRISRENLTGIRVIRAFGNDNHEKERFEDTNEAYASVSKKLFKLMAVSQPSFFLLLNVAILAIFWVSSNMIDAGTLQIGELVAFIEYLFHAMFSLMLFSMVFVMYPKAQVSANRIEELLNEEPLIKNPENGVKQTEVKGEVEFDNVTFVYPNGEEPVLKNISFKCKKGEMIAFIGSTGSGKSTLINLIPRFYDVTVYPNGEEPVLKNISFKCKKGEMIAFIGSTGSGKSTLINLIPRFYDVTEGSIKVDGVDVRDYDLKALRKKIGFIPQKTLLFTGSISSNIKFGKKNAKTGEVVHSAKRDYDLKALRKKIGFIPQKTLLFTGSISSNIKFGKKNAKTGEVVHSAKVAQAYDFISKKPKQFEEIISEGGKNVSGGQKQRLSIARALVRKPEIYIFDDSFSALDFKTDSILRKRLKEETKESVVLVVAQRVGSIMEADRIVVLNEGEIVGIGKHKELLKSCTIYNEIASSQLTKEELEYE